MWFVITIILMHQMHIIYCIQTTICIKQLQFVSVHLFSPAVVFALRCSVFCAVFFYIVSVWKFYVKIWLVVVSANSCATAGLTKWSELRMIRIRAMGERYRHNVLTLIHFFASSVYVIFNSIGLLLMLKNDNHKQIN